MGALSGSAPIVTRNVTYVKQSDTLRQLPSSTATWPDKELLAERFHQFKHAS